MAQNLYNFFGTLLCIVMASLCIKLIYNTFQEGWVRITAPTSTVVLYYNDPPPTRRVKGVFLAGPTSSEEHTAWRLKVIDLLRQKGYRGYVMVPEFREGGFEKGRPTMDDGKPSTIEGSDRSSENITAWESVGLENCSQVLFWMPFSLGEKGDLNSMPGFATRGEVQRAMILRPQATILGMPDKAFRGGLVRYWANRYGLKIHKTLEETVSQIGL